MQTAPEDQAADLRAKLRQALGPNDEFLRLTLSNPDPKAVTGGKVTFRPVHVRGERLIQVARTDGTTAVTRNLTTAEALTELDALLRAPYRQIHLQTLTQDMLARVSRKGKVLVKRTPPSLAAAAAPAGHDRVKEYPLPIDVADPFLQTIGIMNERGQVRPAMQAKFRQINEFIRLATQALPGDAAPDKPLRILDCGCGSAYLTFAMVHYLRHKQGRAVHVVGVDRRSDVIDRCLKLKAQLGWDDLSFEVSAIADYQPPATPDLVISLHACDLATDEAIAKGVRCGSRVILAAPCCQHELHNQLDAAVFRPVLRHGILRERQADILTDAFRALLLRIAGYRTRVVEFVSSEHTAKNLLIMAEKALPAGDPPSIEEYQRLKQFWGVTPALEVMLGGVPAPPTRGPARPSAQSA